MSTPSLYLASASPRRSALLTQIGLVHRIEPVHIDESVREGERPGDYVCRLSAVKAQALQGKLPAEAVCVGADTCVALADVIFGKPEDEADCIRILSALSGRTHQVHTAVTVCQGSRSRTLLSSSDVQFRSLARAECTAYWHSGEPRDKAGAYAIQGRGALFVQEIRGSYSGIVGLPLFETAQLLAEVGIDVTVGAA